MTENTKIGSGRQRGKRRRWLPPLWSPGGFAARAVGLVVVYGLLTLCGLRESTSFISGTTPDGQPLDMPSMLAGLTYLLAWFAVVLAVPVLLLAAAMWWGLVRLLLSPKPHSDPADT